MNERYRMARTTTWLFLVGALGCAEVDLSNDGALDYHQYRSVAVRVHGDANETAYLVEELRDISGFETVVSEPAPADVHLDVSVSVSFTIDSEGHEEIDAIASYVATDARGKVLLSGHESDRSTFVEETILDALDEVAVVFIRPYDY